MVQGVGAHPSHPQNQRDLHSEGRRQNQKIHHYPAAQAVTVGPLTKRRTPTEGGQGLLFNPRRNTNLDLHGKGIPCIYLNPILQSEGMTNEVNPDPQAGMTEPDVAIDQEAVHTPSHRKGLHLKEDQYLILGGLGDHIGETGDHLIEQEDLHLILQAQSLDKDQGPRAEACTPINLKVIPLLEDLHPSFIKDLICQILNITSVPSQQTGHF